MGLIGKIVGGTIGFALGGPLGAIAGAVFGHAFDTPQQQRLESGYAGSLSSVEQSQLAFFVGTFSMLAKLAAADGTVKQEEIKTVESFAVNDLGLSAQSRTIALNIFNTALDSPARFEDFAHQFYERFYSQPQMIEMMIDIMLRVGVSDGSLHASEEAIIMSAVGIFNFNQNRYNQLKSRYVGVSDQPYAVLGCNRDDATDIIKKRYRKLVQDYHPDKIASKGLPEEFNRLAHEKFREIQEAYDAIKKERNIK
jgi:DnaJ like chaperone protein